MKRYVPAVGISGRFALATLKPESSAGTARWANHSLSNMEILNVFLGTVSLIRKASRSHSTMVSQSYPATESAVILIASIRSISKSLSLLVK